MGWWFRADGDRWMRMAAADAEDGREWARDKCVIDLSAWQQRTLSPETPKALQRFPSRRQLARRWTRSEAFVRSLLDECADEWQDPYLADRWAEYLAANERAPAPKRDPKGAQPAPEPDPKRAQPTPKENPPGTVPTPDLDESARTSRPTGAQAGPKEDPTGAQSAPDRRHTRIGETGPVPVQDPNTHNRPARVPVPSWAAKAAADHNRDGLQVMGLVCDAIEAIREVLPNHNAAGTDAKPVLELWVALELPPPEAFLADVQLVARACRECPEPLFARHVRGEGWAGKADLSRAPRTVCSVEQWGDRLALARMWREVGAPTSAYAPLSTIPDSAILAKLDTEIAAVRSAAEPLGMYNRWPEKWRLAVVASAGSLQTLARQLSGEKHNPERDRYQRGFVAALRTLGPVDVAWGIR